MIRFKLDIAGKAEIDRGIDRFSRLVDDYRPVWAEMKDTFLIIERAQFESEGAAESESGSKWAPLSPAYAAAKEHRFGEMPILMATGELYEGLTDEHSPNFVFESFERFMTIGTRVKHAIFHQLGTKKMPQRKEIGFKEETKRRLMKLMQTYMVQIANSVGFTSQSADFFKSSRQMQDRYNFLLNT
jgi:phage gpG-like protein